MKFPELIRITATSLTGVVISLQLAAQEPPAVHHHYKLIATGTFGGPRAFLNTVGYGEYYAGDSQGLNAAGTLAGFAETATPDPYAPNNCVTSDCYATHAFVWRNSGIGLQDLGTLPDGPSSAAIWVSANGLVAGASQNGEIDPQALSPGFPQSRAVLWRDGRIHDLGTLPGPEGGYESGAEAVNSRGQVVGWAMNTVPDPYSMGGASFSLYEPYEPVEYYQVRAFLWQDGVMQDLGTLGTGTDAYAMAINEQGQVIGVSYTNATPNQVVTQMTECATAPIPTQDPFLWEHGKMIDLGTLGGTCGIPYWINSSGQVVGLSDLAGDQEFHPFLWTKARGMQDLGTIGGGTSGYATWVNDSGVVVGGTFLGGGNANAFLWDGTLHDLGAIDGCSWAWAINGRGQVVGNAGIMCNGTGFLWEHGGPMVDLNTLVSSSSGMSVLAAVEINDRGEIAGITVDTNGNHIPILLIPCDDHHPGIEGCDYSLVDAGAVAEPSAAPNGSEHRGITPNHRRGVRGIGMRSPNN